MFLQVLEIQLTQSVIASTGPPPVELLHQPPATDYLCVCVCVLSLISGVLNMRVSLVPFPIMGALAGIQVVNLECMASREVSSVWTLDTFSMC